MMSLVPVSESSEAPDRDAGTAVAVAAAMLLPLSDALSFLGKLANTWRAFGEKLSNSLSFCKGSSGPSGSNTSTSNESASSLGVTSYNANREDISGAHPTDASDYGSQGQQQRQAQTLHQQHQKQHPNGLEFSIAEFLAVRVWRRVPKCNMPDTTSPHQPSVDASVASKEATAEQSRTGADSSASGFFSSFCGRLGGRRDWYFGGGTDRNLRVLRSPLPQPHQPRPKGLPQSKRPRSTDKTLVLDLDETLIHARRELAPDERFDFMVTLPPKHRVLEPHKLAGNLSLCLSPETDVNSLGEDRGASAPDKGAAATSGLLMTRRPSGCSGKPTTNYGGWNGRRIYVKKRPQLRKFLETVSRRFEVVVFTAARADFANAVLEEIDPGRQMVDHVLSRESCTRLSKARDTCGDGVGDDGREVRSSWRRRRGRRNAAGSTDNSSNKRRPAMVKDLGILGRPLSKVIMVENSLDAIRYHLENAVHISSFYGDRKDTGLLSILEQLQPLVEAADVRDEIIRLYVQAQALKEGHNMLTEEAPKF